MPPIYSNLPCGPPPSIQAHGSLRSDIPMHIVSGRTQGRWRNQDAYLPGSAALNLRMRPEQSLRNANAPIPSSSVTQARPSVQYGAAGSTADSGSIQTRPLDRSQSYQPRSSGGQQQSLSQPPSTSSLYSGGAPPRLRSSFSGSLTSSTSVTGTTTNTTTTSRTSATYFAQSASATQHYYQHHRTSSVHAPVASNISAGSVTHHGSSSGVGGIHHASARRASDGSTALAGHVTTTTTALRYPDSTLMPSRPNLATANAVVGSHVITTISGLHSGGGYSNTYHQQHPPQRNSTGNSVRSYGSQYSHGSASAAALSSRLSGGMIGGGGGTSVAGYGAAVHGNDAGAQSRLLVGSRGYSRTSAWPVRHVQQPSQARVAAPTVDLHTLGLTDDIIEATASRALAHWDATGQYTLDQMRRFVETACTRMELDLLCVLTALLYTDRLRAKFPDAGACSCAKRVLTMGMMTASKYHKDNPFDNKSWARFCDVGLLTMNGMELQFLEALEFELFINPNHITALLDDIQSEQGFSLHDASQAVFEALTPQPSTPASPTPSLSSSYVRTTAESGILASGMCVMQFAALSPVTSDESTQPSPATTKTGTPIAPVSRPVDASASADLSYMIKRDGAVAVAKADVPLRLGDVSLSGAGAVAFVQEAGALSSDKAEGMTSTPAEDTIMASDSDLAVAPCAEPSDRIATGGIRPETVTHGNQHVIITESNNNTMVVDTSSRSSITSEDIMTDCASAADTTTGEGGLSDLADGGKGPVARVSFYTRGATAAHDGVVIPAESGRRAPVKGYKSDYFLSECSVIRVPPVCVIPLY